MKPPRHPSQAPGWCWRERSPIEDRTCTPRRPLPRYSGRSCGFRGDLHWISQRHEIDERELTRGRGESRREYVGVGQVAPVHAQDRSCRGDLESPSLFGIEHRREYAGRVESREAAPVYGAVCANQRSRIHVSNEAIVVDALVRHVSLRSRNDPPPPHRMCTTQSSATQTCKGDFAHRRGQFPANGCARVRHLARSMTHAFPIRPINGSRQGSRHESRRLRGIGNGT